MRKLEQHICICGSCQIASRLPVFVMKGRETQFRVENPHRKIGDKYVVDNCLLRNAKREEKCDFLFQCSNENFALLIELKGSDVIKGLNQIEPTITLLMEDLKGKSITAYIIPTRVYGPDIRNSTYLRLQRLLQNRLIIKNNVYTEII